MRKNKPANAKCYTISTEIYINIMKQMAETEPLKTNYNNMKSNTIN